MAKFNFDDLQEEAFLSGMEGKKILLYGPNSVGKALVNSARIPTLNGPKRVRDIKVGDYLFGRDGKPTKVLKVFPQEEQKEVYEVVFLDGRSVLCCSEHLWHVKNDNWKANDGFKTITTQQMIEYGLRKSNGDIAFKVPLCEPVQYETKDFPIHPYVLGAFLGNGCFTQNTLQYSSKTTEVLDEIVTLMGWTYHKNSDSFIYTFKDKSDNIINTKDFLAELPELIGQNDKNKFIPKKYLYGSHEQRLDLLNGLLATVSDLKDYKMFDYNSTSYELISDITNLCYSLGFEATIKKESYRDSFYCTVVPKSNTNLYLGILDIHSLEYKEDMTCFEVDNDEHLFLANDYIVTHNTKQTTKLDRPFLIMTESGGSAVKCPKVPCNKWSKFNEIVDDITNERNFEKRWEQIRTVIIDTAENLVDLAERATCSDFGVRDLSEIEGRKNGYKIARSNFQLQINRLTSRGYCVVFICHEENVTLEDEITGEEYNFVQPKGTGNEKSSMRMLRDLCDFCIYLRPNGIDSETAEIIPSTAICHRTKNVFARSRFSMQTFIDPFTAQGLVDAIEKAVKKSAEEEDAQIEKYQHKKDDYTKEDYFEIIKPYIIKLTPIAGAEVQKIVEAELGEGRKITSVTDEEIALLENIYNNLVTKATLLGVEV